MTSPILIVVDDETDLAGFVCNVAEQAGFDASHINSGRIFIDQFNHRADVIILDLMMPDIDGIEIIRFLAEIQCSAHLILMSGFDSGVLHSAEKLATEQGLNLAGSLYKPFRVHELNQLLSKLEICQQSVPTSERLSSPTIEQLKHALHNDELIIYYQPKIALKNDSASAVEALVRWQHPDYGLVAPDHFIPLAEEFGIIDELTWVVLDQSMKQCKAWLDQGLTMQVAINMSADTLKELDLPEKMGQMIHQYGLAPSQIILEITESALMQELTKSLDILTRLRMKGIHLSIDDFGTGYSSLVQLHRAPFSEIKIDRSFVSKMENDPEAAAIVEIIIMLGHKLNMKTVAEGVETEFCQQKLTELACDQSQGFLTSRPLPAAEIFAWFENHHKN